MPDQSEPYRPDLAVSQDEGRAQRAPSFTFARQLRDPEFRAYIAEAGYTSRTPVVALHQGDSWTKGRAQALVDRGRVMLARQDPYAPHGWELRWMDDEEGED